MQMITTNVTQVKAGEIRELLCIYAHSIPPYDKFFYIGLSKLNEVYDFSDAYRNNFWRATVKEDTQVRITLLCISINIIDCNQQLRRMINEFRPEANIKGYAVTGSTMITCIQGVNAGASYPSQLEAAQKNGITPGALSNHLNGRPGYDTIRGMKFKRGSI